MPKRKQQRVNWLVRRSGKPSAPEAAIAGKDNGLGARPHAEFVEESRDVIADCLFADREALCDLRVAKTFGKQRQHLSLARGERGET